MLRLPRIFALLSLQILAAEAFTFQGRLALDGVGNATVSSSSRVQLGATGKSALIRQDGAFELFNLDEGRHTLTPLIPGYVMPTYVLTLTASSSDPSGSSTSLPVDLTPHIQLLLPGRAPLSASAVPSLPYPLVIRPLSKEDYFTPRGGVNILGMLKSPIVLMMLFSGVMMYFMPKLMASVEADPELKKEMIEARKRMNGIKSDWSGSLSGMLAGGEGSSGTNTASSTSLQAGPKGNGVQKRKGR